MLLSLLRLQLFLKNDQNVSFRTPSLRFVSTTSLSVSVFPLSNVSGHRRRFKRNRACFSGFLVSFFFFIFSIDGRDTKLGFVVSARSKRNASLTSRRVRCSRSRRRPLFRRIKDGHGTSEHASPVLSTMKNEIARPDGRPIESQDRYE